MDNFKKTLADVEGAVKKGISTSNEVWGNTNSSTALTVRQDLSADIVNLGNRNTPFRDMVTKAPGQGAAFTFNTKKSLFMPGDNTSPREVFYADGGLPTMRSTQYGTTTVAYKAIGYEGEVTGLAQASGESIVDLYATEVESTSRRVIQALEWLSFWSTTTDLNTGGLGGFPGLDSLITTNVIDAAGAPISKALIDKAIKRIISYGGQPTHIFASNGITADINNLYNSYAQVLVSNVDQANLTYGFNVPNIMTAAGVQKVVPDFFLNPANTYPSSNGTSSYPAGATSSTVFILAMPFIKVKVLKAIGMEELGRVADKRSFFVNEYSGIELTAEPWCAKIINVLEQTL